MTTVQQIYEEMQRIAPLALAESWDNPGPVSYTHLQRCLFDRHKEEPWHFTFWTKPTAASAAKSRCASTVSYTHLDVYKRQHQHHP